MRQYFIRLWTDPPLLRQALDRYYQNDVGRQELVKRRDQLSSELDAIKEKELRALSLAVNYPDYHAKLETIMGDLKKSNVQLKSALDSCSRQLAALQNQDAIKFSLVDAASRVSSLMDSWRDHEWRTFLRSLGFRLDVNVPPAVNDVMDSNSEMEDNMLQWIYSPQMIFQFDSILTSAFASQPS